ncbi:MAG: hypothetical protein C0594_02775 [Marinilabiliales bacterium]|nr:MAG: hypothetical protein C0594_02775 [Marinilabiliales bacterium]
MGNDTVCYGDSTFLYPSNIMGDLTWSTSSMEDTILIVPQSDSLVWLSMDTIGCIAYDSLVLVSLLSPVVTITASDTVCSGDTVVLNAEGADYYLWESGDNASEVEFVAYSDSTIIVQGFDAYCSGYDSISLIVKPQPDIAISGDTIICEGSSTTITLSGADQYIWCNGATDNTIGFISGSDTTCEVMGILNGCSSTLDVNIHTLTVPDAQIIGPDTICSNLPTEYSAAGTGSFYWSTGSLDDTILFVAVHDTVLYLTETNGYCENTDSLFITVNSSPAVSVTADTSVCEGESVLLVASGADGYAWSNMSSDDSILVYPVEDTVFYVIAEQNDCYTEDSVVIVVNPLPQYSILQDTFACSGDSAELWASGGDDYLWGNGYTDSVLTIYPVADSYYYVTISSGNCSVTDSVFLSVEEIPVVSISGPDSVCYGEYATLEVSGGFSYNWSNGSIDSINTALIYSDTTFYVTVSNDFCSIIEQQSLTHIPLPVASISGNTQICMNDTLQLIASGNYDSINWVTYSTLDTLALVPAGDLDIQYILYSGQCTITDSVNVLVHPLPQSEMYGDTLICEGTDAVIGVLGSGDYLWSTGSSLSEIMVTPSISTDYYVTVSNAYQCTSLDSIFVEVQAMINAEIIGDSAICYGDTAVLQALPSGNYEWSNGSTDQQVQISPDQSVDMQVIITYQACSDTTVFPVQVFNEPIIGISGDTVLCAGDFLQLTVNNADSYLWSDGSTDQLYLNGLPQDGYYSVTVEAGLCSSSDSVFVVVNDLPTAVINAQDTICNGQNLEMGIVFTGQSPFSYTIRAQNEGVYNQYVSWNDTLIQISPTDLEVYVVENLVDANQCALSVAD